MKKGKNVEEPSEVPGHSVGDLDAKTEVGRNLGILKSKQDYKRKEAEKESLRKVFPSHVSA